MKIVEQLKTILGEDKAVKVKTVIDKWLKEQNSKAKKREAYKLRTIEKKADSYAEYVKEELIKEGEKYGEYVKAEALKEARKQINELIKKANDYAKLVQEDTIKEADKYAKIVKEEAQKEYEKYLGESFVDFVDSLNKEINETILSESKAVKLQDSKYKKVISEIGGLLEYRLGNKRIDNKLRQDIKEMKKQNYILSKRLQEASDENKSLSEKITENKNSAKLPKSDRIKLRKPIVNESTKKEIKRDKELDKKPILKKVNESIDNEMTKLQRLSGIVK